ncbi:Alpha-L-fucosidase 2 [Colletotrichum sp. SAR 10_86]|nr:Alpha-L-fucosidase 2 [Colletotrichum sp. SAR 10_76]KAI8231499.1 Alpha-L-fucosidase 2 [Colletotrichum sp. SAR 10_86]
MEPTLGTIWAIRETFVGIIAVNAACIRPLFSSAHWLSSSKGSSSGAMKYTGSGDRYGHQLVTIGGGGQSTDRSMPAKRRHNKYNMTEFDNNSSEEHIVKSSESANWPQASGDRDGSLTTLLATASNAKSSFDGSRYLWYTKPTTEWEQGALPIGNGRLGGTVWGGANETLTINEDTIWSGPIQDRTPPNALATLPVARELFLSGKITEGGQLVLREMTPAEKSERQFGYFGNLDLDFGHSGNLENYVRWLDTKQGNSGSSYAFDGVNFTREFVASYPAGVLAARFTSSEEGALNLKASFSRLANILVNVASTAGGVNSVTLMGSSGQPLDENPILFTGQARFVAPGAKFENDGSVLRITGATAIDLFFDAETNYRFASQDEWEAEIDRKLNAALTKGYSHLRDEALKDSSSLLGRASIDLGKSPRGLSALPTDERVAIARNDSSDVELSTLTWNLGRHMLVGASRNTEADIDMPANLQGIWNNKTTAAWGGKYTININTEMNYWSAGPTNLIETQEPLFDLMKVANPRGKAMAKAMYGCDGTMFHHNLDVWGDPGATDNYTSSTMWPMGASWLVQHMVDHYHFTGDKAFLADVAYPFLIDVATFYECYTFEHEGYRITGPSLSPENTFVVPSNFSEAGRSEPMDIDIPMDNQLMHDVFSAIIEAADILGIDDTNQDLKKAKDFLPRIKPAQIGSKGQILEWRYEYKESAPSHRHLSPLYALHPGKEFSPLVNETLSEAAQVLLDRRREAGSGSTGWSRTWMINMYARSFRGADAWEQVKGWFATFPTANLWNTDKGSTFQIDGNYGFTSGITEMLLQSHTGTVHILPALPGKAVPTGSAKGLVARGNFVIDVEWENGAFKRAGITSKIGAKLKLRVGNAESVLVDGNKYTVEIRTTEGQVLEITPA